MTAVKKKSVSFPKLPFFSLWFSSSEGWLLVRGLPGRRRMGWCRCSSVGYGMHLGMLGYMICEGMCPYGGRGWCFKCVAVS